MASEKAPDNDWMASAQQFQQQFVNQWTQALQNMPSMAQGVAGFDPSNPMAAFAALMPQGAMNHPLGMQMPTGVPGQMDISQIFQKAAGHKVSIDPARWLEIQNNYLKEAVEVWNQGLHVRPKGDRRFDVQALARQAQGRSPVCFRRLGQQPGGGLCGSGLSAQRPDVDGHGRGGAGRCQNPRAGPVCGPAVD